MVADAHNRISDLLGQPIDPAVRSPAQREAARRNGSHSRGPVTVEGKSRSRLNSMKHGLLARHIMPASDIREHDRLFVRARRELADQFKPVDFSESVIIDGLAHDYVQLSRARNLLEALQRPPSLEDHEAAQWAQYNQARQELRLLEGVIALADGEGSFRCTAAQAKTLADQVVTLVQAIKFELTRDDVENDEAKLSDFEREELRQLRSQWAMIRPAAKRLGNREHLAGVFRGEAPIAPRELRRLRKVLSQIADRTRQQLNGSRDLMARMKRQQDAAAALAAAPESLMLLQRYVVRIEKQISQKLGQLKRC